MGMGLTPIRDVIREWSPRQTIAFRWGLLVGLALPALASWAASGWLGTVAEPACRERCIPYDARSRVLTGPEWGLVCECMSPEKLIWLGPVEEGMRPW